MGAPLPEARDPEIELLVEKSKRLVVEMDALIQRAKILQLEHRVVIEKIKEKTQNEV